MISKTGGKLFPFGNRIIVKLIEATETSSGLLKPEGTEPAFCSWAEVVSLPEHDQNLYLDKLKVGDLVAYLHFAKDVIIHPDTDEKYLALELESGSAGLKGQVVAIIHR